MNEEFKKILIKQHYGIVGNHSAVKLCHWLKQSLIHDRVCYKESFYGIKSHRCLQMTPTVNQCTHNCIFCWRHQGFPQDKLKNYDEPKFILENAINEQRRLITGFKGDSRCDPIKWEEANDPNMLACSLTGEPTIYPKLSDFFSECHKKNITTFLVTNGTNPKALENMDTLPKQLYISIVAPNKELYKKICSPLISNGWERINKTLELLDSLNTRTVIRHTLVNGWNMDKKYIDEYSKLIKKSNPQFIEPKGYVFVGYSRKRMNLANMPSHEMILDFSKKLSQNTNYLLTNEKKESRVVLLSKNKKMERFDK